VAGVGCLAVGRVAVVGWLLVVWLSLDGWVAGGRASGEPPVHPAVRWIAGAGGRVAVVGWLGGWWSSFGRAPSPGSRLALAYPLSSL
jgi:hypothetical protein